MDLAYFGLFFFCAGSCHRLSFQVSNWGLKSQQFSSRLDIQHSSDFKNLNDFIPMFQDKLLLLMDQQIWKSSLAVQSHFCHVLCSIWPQVYSGKLVLAIETLLCDVTRRSPEFFVSCMIHLLLKLHWLLSAPETPLHTRFHNKRYCLPYFFPCKMILLSYMIFKIISPALYI